VPIKKLARLADQRQKPPSGLLGERDQIELLNAEQDRISREKQAARSELEPPTLFSGPRSNKPLKVEVDGVEVAGIEPASPSDRLGLLRA